MQVDDLLSLLKTNEVSISINDQKKLEVRTKHSPISDNLKKAIIHNRQALIKRLTSNTGEATTSISPLHNINHKKKENNTESFPISQAQKRMWFVHNFDNGTTAYNRSKALALCGNLSIEILQICLNILVKKHEILRTRFIEVDNKVEQCIEKEALFHLEIQDTCESSDNLLFILDKNFSKIFALSELPLIKGYLIKQKDQQAIFQIVFHHIILDGWSVSLFFEELIQNYKMITHYGTAGDSQSGITFSEYVNWQQKKLKSLSIRPAESFWKKTLENAPPFLQLPTDFPRASQQSLEGDSYTFNIPVNIEQAVGRLCRMTKTTPYVFLLTVFKILLYRYTGQKDIIVGSPSANRKDSRWDNLMGFLVNMLPIRNQLNQKLNFLDTLKSIRKSVLQAHDYQDMPFEHIVKVVNPSRNLSYSPLFQVIFLFESSHRINTDIENLHIKYYEHHPKVSFYDLSLIITNTGEGLNAVIEYSTRLFCPTKIERMAESYLLLLSGITDDPNLTINTYPITSTEDQRKQLWDWNRDKEVIIDDRHLCDLFESQVESHPDSIAVSCDSNVYTYRELSRYSNKLAHYLINTQSTTKGVIGLCFEPSIELVVAILSVLKCGAAYVPIDRNYPLNRIQYIVQDTQMEVLLTEKYIWDELFLNQHITNQLTPLYLNKEYCRLPRLRSMPDYCPQPADNPSSKSTLAYILYTSGSTGKPKGCAVTHHNVIRLLHAMWNIFHYQRDDIWVMLHSFTFDYSVFELWGGLSKGSKIVIVPYKTRYSSDEFYKLLNQESISILNITPSFFKQLINVDNENQSKTLPLKQIRQIAIGGEALDKSSLTQWVSRYGCITPQLVNLYGITEASVISTAYSLKNSDFELTNNSLVSSNHSIPIGYPLADTCVYLLDAEQQPLPIGVTGELYISGSGVSKGYLNREDLTEERFINNPCANSLPQYLRRYHQTLYRTGDLARFREDGCLQYHGRIDSQVKISGFRIELSEIESALLSNPELEQATVTVIDDSGDTRIIAYIVPTTTLISDKNTEKNRLTIRLREYLKEKLPEYMLPAYILILDKIPITINGKIDKRLLPKPDKDNVIKEYYVSPRDAIEVSLAIIWEEVLGINKVGVFDNFFSLGGDSMKSNLVQMLARKEGIELPPRALFKHQTINALASTLQHSTSFPKNSTRSEVVI